MAEPIHHMLLDDRDAAVGVTVPGLHDYLETHPVHGMPSVGDLDLKRKCTRLILYNVQSHTTRQIWEELTMCLSPMIDGIIKIKHISGLNRNPHTDLWVCKDLGSSILALIRERTKIRMKDWGSLAMTARREQEEASSRSNAMDDGSELTLFPQDDDHSSRVQGWRLALWQPW